MIYDSREPDEHWLYLNSDRTYLDQIFRSEYSPKEFRMKTVDSDKLRVGDLVVARYFLSQKFFPTSKGLISLRDFVNPFVFF